MITRLLFVIVFIAGVSSGWLGKAWITPEQSISTASIPDDKNDTVVSSSISAVSTQTFESTVDSSGAVNSNELLSGTQNFSGSYLQDGQQPAKERSNGSTLVSYFKNLLDDRLYYDATLLYQEQYEINGQTAVKLKRIILNRLNLLSETRNNNDFSELIENYLSIYYDDVDVLLLLAKFNQANGSYLEAVDVYLLAKTYAYTDADQNKLLTHFNGFIEGIDSFYTNQKNWPSLLNFYSHISTSGLMTSPHQYRQALAHLRSGDEYIAIEQFRQLTNDSVVGESAVAALNKLTNLNGVTPANVTSPASSSSLEASESIALQKLGNQYLVDLTVNRQDEVKLLIDTGASITTLSRSSFDSLTTNGDAVVQDRRVFRTASGVIMGTVYSVPQLSLGPYVLNNTQIAVLDFDVSRNIDGLLGMNVLGQFRFQIDQENARLLLNRQ